MDPTALYAWTAIFGVLTGFRSMLPLAFLTFFSWRGFLPLPGHWSFFSYFVVFLLFALLAIAELTFDKRRGTPNRTAPLGLLGRFFMGGLGGALLSVSTFFPWWKGAAIGAVLALFGAALGYSLRQYFTESIRGNDFSVAVGEDIITALGAYWVLVHLS
jgi:uncharacterized membrane protein